MTPPEQLARADSDNLPPPEVIAQKILDDLEAALEQFRLIAAFLNGRAVDLVSTGALRNPYFFASVDQTRRLVHAAEDAEAA